MGEGWRDHEPAAARRARGLRARIPAGSGDAVWRQFLAHCRLRRDGAFGAAPQTEDAWRLQWRPPAEAGVISRIIAGGSRRPMSRIAYVNGRYVPHAEAVVHIEDRGYQFSDGVYEVVAVKDGRLIDNERHMVRLERSLGELRIAL